MDYQNPPPSWVEHAVIEMRQSQTYRDKIADEWYETLPVPAWDAQRNWLVVGFGVNIRTAGPMSPVNSRPPHIACVLSYPEGAQQWSADNLAQRVWPSSAGAVEPAFAPQLTGDTMERRRRYYGALSDALREGAFNGHAPMNPPAACAAARVTRDAFFPAAPYANLVPIYAGALHHMDDWLKTNCGGR